MSRQRQQPTGFTLIEITFSIAFLTMIMTVVLAGFIGIMALYNRAQGLGRTAESSRNSVDVLTLDLRQTTKVEYWPTGTAVGAADEFRYDDGGALVNASPRALPISNSDPNRTKVKDFYCLSSDTRQVGYGLLLNSRTGKYQLARFPGVTGTVGCTNISSKIEILAEGDVWTDNNSPALPAVSPVDGKDYRPFKISKVTQGNSASSVWQVKVASHRGTRIPGIADRNFVTDQFSAETTLQAVVDARR